jgi:two-component system, OmpR family, response regulator QseB
VRVRYQRLSQRLQALLLEQGVKGRGKDHTELAARIRAVLRRRNGRADPVIRHGPLTLDPATHEVTWYGTAVTLSGREFAVLQALLERPGAVLSRL